MQVTFFFLSSAALSCFSCHNGISAPGQTESYRASLCLSGLPLLFPNNLNEFLFKNYSWFQCRKREIIRFPSCKKCFAACLLKVKLTCSSLVYSWKHSSRVQLCCCRCCCCWFLTLSASFTTSSWMLPNRLNGKYTQTQMTHCCHETAAFYSYVWISGSMFFMVWTECEKWLFFKLCMSLCNVCL